MVRVNRLSLFAFLWALQVLVQHTVFDNWLQDGRPFAWLQVFMACSLMLMPSSLLLLLSLSVFTVLHYAVLSPFFVNHHVNEILISLLLVGVILNALMNFGKAKHINSLQLRKRIFEQISSPIRLSFVLIYWFAFVSKLNTDFVNPAVSCAVIMYDKTVLSLPFLPTGHWVYMAVIWGTIIFEFLLPVLLAFRKTRQQAIFMALAFHFFLSFSGHRSFSSHAYAVLFVFFADDFVPFLQHRLNMLHKNIKRFTEDPSQLYQLLRVLVVPAIVALIVAVVFSDDHPWLRSWLRRVWYVFSLIYLGVVALYLLKRPASERSFTTKQLLLPKMRPLCWLFPIIVVFNAMNPYVGLKTHTSITMYSNLRTEGDIQNHIIISGSLKLFDYQEDWLEILQASVPRLQIYSDENVYVNRIQFFQRIIFFGLSGNAIVRYKGNIYRVGFKNGEVESPPEIPLPGFFERKLMFFRTIDKQPPCICRH